MTSGHGTPYKEKMSCPEVGTGHQDTCPDVSGQMSRGWEVGGSGKDLAKPVVMIPGKCERSHHQSEGGSMIYRQCFACGEPCWPPDWDTPCTTCVAKARVAAESPAAPQDFPTPEPGSPSPPAFPLGKREEAVVWLAAQLATGPLDATEMLRRATAARISPKTLQRAKRTLDVRSTRVRGVGAAGSWVWGFMSEAGVER
jgi:hypothetical protein